MADTAIIVQLLNSSGTVERQQRVRAGSVKFDYINAGKYYMSALIDTNGNGIWDTGDYAADLQPESVYYYPKEIECKEKFDVTLSWNPEALPRNRQKPGAIVKQKPDKEQKKLQNRNAQRAKQLGIEYVKKQMVK